jgi:hypothetical protein
MRERWIHGRGGLKNGVKRLTIIEDLSSLPELNDFPNMQSLADWCQKGFLASAGHSAPGRSAPKRSR